MKFLTVSEKKFPKNTQFTESKNVADLMADVANLDREALWVIHLDIRLNLIEREMVSLGHVGGSICYPREVFRRAVIQGSSGIILVHNHPSGDLTPSNEDCTVTSNIKKAAKIMNIDFLDHIIIGSSGGYYSFADRGTL